LVGPQVQNSAAPRAAAAANFVVVVALAGRPSKGRHWRQRYYPLLVRRGRTMSFPPLSSFSQHRLEVGWPRRGRAERWDSASVRGTELDTVHRGQGD
jgi:hypothetical protein